jgi:uncharacterized protein (TIGR02284 family)
MIQTSNTIELLNDLIRIHNDRIEGYDRAVEELKSDDPELRALFLAMVSESHSMKSDLANEVQVLKGTVDTGTTNSGKVYRAWMDVKAVFTGHDRKAVLENCEFGEDAAQKAYDKVLKSEDLPAYLREMIETQQQSLMASHDEIKELRDQTA